MAAALPAPGVAEYQLRQHVQRRRFGAPVECGDAHQHIVDTGLGVFDENVEIPVIVERTRIQQLVFRRTDSAPPVLGNEIRIGERSLRIFVEHLEVGMRRRRIQVVIELLDVLAMIALAVREAEQPLLEDRVALVPQRQRQTESLLLVGESGDAVLPPPVGAAARVVVRKVVPGIAVRAVVLPDGAPLPFAQVRPPFLPGGRCGCAFGEALLFDVHAVILWCGARLAAAFPGALRFH